MQIRSINIGSIIGEILSLMMSHKIWGWQGFWFTFGLLMVDGMIKIEWRNPNV